MLDTAHVGGCSLFLWSTIEHRTTFVAEHCHSQIYINIKLLLKKKKERHSNRKYWYWIWELNFNLGFCTGHCWPVCLVVSCLTEPPGYCPVNASQSSLCESNRTCLCDTSWQFELSATFTPQVRRGKTYARRLSICKPQGRSGINNDLHSCSVNILHFSAHLVMWVNLHLLNAAWDCHHCWILYFCVINYVSCNCNVSIACMWTQ